MRIGGSTVFVPRRVMIHKYDDPNEAYKAKFVEWYKKHLIQFYPNSGTYVCSSLGIAGYKKLASIKEMIDRKLNGTYVKRRQGIIR